MPRRSKPAVQPIADKTLILDNGAFTMKAGFATSSPDPLRDCHEIPNCIAKARDKRIWVGAQLEKCNDFGEMAFRRPVEKGYLVNWEAEKEIWEQTFFDKGARLECDPSETNIVLTEAPNTPQALQGNSDQIVFEEFEFAAYYRCIGPSLDAYNDIPALFGKAPRQSGSSVTPAEAILVIDSGFSHTTVTPLLWGRPVQAATRRLDIGGKFLTNYLKELVSIRHYNMMDETYLMNEVKEAVCYVSNDFQGDLERTWKGGVGNGRKHDRSDIVVDYVLPDYNTHKKGYVRPHDPAASATARGAVPAPGESVEDLMTLGNERFTVPELLFSPTDVGMKQAGLPEMIMQSLASLPGAIWPVMLANVVLVGGNANIKGFKERLETELRKITPSECVVRVARPGNPVKYTWLGGAHMASDRSVLEKLLVTRQQYQEFGSHWLAKRFGSGVSK